MKEFKLTSIDGLILSVCLWDDVKNPKGILQLIHGSAENLSRYEEFCEYMNKQGYIVIGSDQRGHGETAFDNDLPLGYFSNFNGWKKLVDDQLLLNSYVKKNWMDLPVFLLGHSMGSFVAMDYAIKYSKTIDGLIISGTTDRPYWEILPGIALGALDEWFTGPKRPAKWLWKWVFGPFNRKWKDRPNANGSEWQSQVQKVQEDFANDPRMGQPFTTSGFKDMLVGAFFVKQKRHLKLIDKNLPILIISGKADPMGRYGKGPTEVYNKFRSLGYNVNLKLYPRQRHEILFEPKKKTVMKDISTFMNDNI